MTRAPRLGHRINNLTSHIRTRFPAWLGRKSISRKTMAYAGAGLALAGVAGAAAVTYLGGHPASATGARHAAKRTGNPPAAAGHASPASHPTAPAKREETPAAVAKKAANTGHRQVASRDMLTPVGISGPQAWMPITPARYENAKTIIHQAVAEHMGLRSAVIAVATSMQESTLLNLSYGDQDSLGLFQQRPSSGWGTAEQIQRPAYAAGAFLHALRGYQANNPDWARQPVWEPAQGVQGSAFPDAYAKWEAQAAHLVESVAGPKT
jgi:hypothetical protein